MGLRGQGGRRVRGEEAALAVRRLLRGRTIGRQPAAHPARAQPRPGGVRGENPSGDPGVDPPLVRRRRGVRGESHPTARRRTRPRRAHPRGDRPDGHRRRSGERRPRLLRGVRRRQGRPPIDGRTVADWVGPFPFVGRRRHPADRGPRVPAERRRDPPGVPRRAGPRRTAGLSRPVGPRAELRVARRRPREQGVTAAAVPGRRRPRR